MKNKILRKINQAILVNKISKKILIDIMLLHPHTVIKRNMRKLKKL
jgi:hypothetical protein